ncbi:hypothetical protein SLA2020_068640 [Shorea laevis]
MASAQCSLGTLGPCQGLNRVSKPLFILQSGNATHFKNSIPKLSQTSVGGSKKNLTSCCRKSKDDQWRVWCSADGAGETSPEGSVMMPNSVLNLTQEFYNAINAKDTKKLDQILSKDCTFQDLIFYIPVGGKQSIIDFLRQVMDAMGPNVHFVIDGSMKGENFTATINWHLEWKLTELPFTSYHNSFECQPVDGKLLIRKITGIQEFPMKPGDFILKGLKATGSFFDSFPVAADALLAKPNGGLVKLLDMLGAYKKR